MNLGAISEDLKRSLAEAVDEDIRELKAGAIATWDARVRVADRREEIDQLRVRLKNYRHGVISILEEDAAPTN